VSTDLKEKSPLVTKRVRVVLEFEIAVDSITKPPRGTGMSAESLAAEAQLLNAIVANPEQLERYLQYVALTEMIYIDDRQTDDLLEVIFGESVDDRKILLEAAKGLPEEVQEVLALRNYNCYNLSAFNEAFRSRLAEVSVEEIEGKALPAGVNSTE
jgi:hypothetical protein